MTYTQSITVTAGTANADTVGLIQTGSLPPGYPDAPFSEPGTEVARPVNVIIPASPALQPEHVSLALWFRADRYTDFHWDWKVLAYQGLIDCWQSSYSLKSSMWNDSGLVFMLWDGQASHRTEPIAGVWDGQWHHAVGTYDGSEIRLYVDGTLAAAWRGLARSPTA